MKILAFIIIVIIALLTCNSYDMYCNRDNIRHDFINTELNSFDDIDGFIKTCALVDTIIGIIFIIALFCLNY